MSRTADRVLLLLPTTSYKAADFLAAAERLGVEVVVGTDRRQALERAAPGRTLTVDLVRPARAVRAIEAFHRARPLRAVLGADDETTLVAARAAQALGLPHNPPAAVRASRDKFEMRRRLAAAGLRGPVFERRRLADDPERLAADADYPCVLKPLSLAASRGVIRADDPAAFVAAFRRIAAILADPELSRAGVDTRHLLVESFLPGAEVAVEGLLDRGRLRTLALLDKPDPLDGPTFEETLFVTPSRHPEAVQRAIEDETARGCAALGLREGPVHAELRVHDGRPWLLEIAARTIGGLCSRTLRFGAGISLEELVLRHALGLPTAALGREGVAAGVMMLPIPRAGTLRAVRGLGRARACPDVEEVTLTVHRGARIVPLPEGHRYLGFLFARAPTAERVEASLRRAQRCLSFEIE